MRRVKDTKKHLLEARKNADAILATGANRLLLIEAILIVCVFAAMFTAFYSALSLLLSAVLGGNTTLSPLLSYAVLLIYLVAVIFFAAPVVLGLFRLTERMQAGDTPVLADLFYFLSSRKRYLRGLRITWIGSLKLVTAIVAVDAIHTFLNNQLADIPSFRPFGVLAIALIIFLYVLWMLFPYSKLYCMLKQGDAPLDKDAYLRAPHGGLRLLCFFLPWLLLGFVSIGLLLVLDVLPRMLLTYFCDCERKKHLFDL